MMKRILFAAAVAALASGCGSSRNDTGSSSGSSTTTGTTSSGSTTGSGSTGGTTTTSSSTGTTGACTPVTIAQARTTAPYTPVCLSGVTVVYSTSPGAPADGGTTYNGTYYVADTNGDAMLVFKTKYAAPTGDPARGNKMVVSGKVETNPKDGGATATVEVAGINIAITDQGAGTLPTPKTVNFSDLDSTTPNTALIGSYVLVPAGTYTENAAEPLMHKSTFQDGLSLTDAAGHKVLVDTYSLAKGSADHDKSCYTLDGGGGQEPDLSAGGFKAILDYDRLPSSGAQAPVLIIGDCTNLH